MLRFRKWTKTVIQRLLQKCRCRRPQATVSSQARVQRVACPCHRTLGAQHVGYICMNYFKLYENILNNPHLYYFHLEIFVISKCRQQPQLWGCCVPLCRCLISAACFHPRSFSFLTSGQGRAGHTAAPGNTRPHVSLQLGTRTWQSMLWSGVLS